MAIHRHPKVVSVDVVVGVGDQKVAGVIVRTADTAGAAGSYQRTACVVVMMIVVLVMVVVLLLQLLLLLLLLLLCAAGALLVARTLGALQGVPTKQPCLGSFVTSSCASSSLLVSCFAAVVWASFRVQVGHGVGGGGAAHGIQRHPH